MSRCIRASITRSGALATTIAPGHRSSPGRRGELLFCPQGQGGNRLFNDVTNRRCDASRIRHGTGFFPARLFPPFTEDRDLKKHFQAHENDPDERERIVSSYQTRMGSKLWVITEHDRSATNV